MRGHRECLELPCASESTSRRQDSRRNGPSAKKRPKPAPKPMEGRCGFWLSKKQRFCSFEVMQGNDTITAFCFHHQPRSSPSDPDDGVLDAVPCIIDPSHVVKVSSLSKHCLKKCNSLKLFLSRRSTSFFSENINMSPSFCAANPVRTTEELLEMLKQRVSEQLSVAKQAAHKAAADAAANVNDTNTFQSLRKRIERAYEKLREPMECRTVTSTDFTPFSSDGSVTVERNGPLSKSHAKRSKHDVQCRAIADELTREGLFDSPLNEGGKGTAFVELGAGKGVLTFHTSQRCTAVDAHWMVDRQSFQQKFDSHCDSKGSVDRISLDIRHLDISGLPGIEAHFRRVVMGKHLCGGATDMALRCACRPTKSGQPVASHVCIAICCHNRCDLDTYIDMSYLQEEGLIADFEKLRGMASWAICCTNDEAYCHDQLEDKSVGEGVGKDGRTPVPTEIRAREEKRLHLGEGSHSTSQLIMSKICEKTGLNPEAARDLGFKCKHILDVGRVRYLRKHGFEAKLIRYVPSTVTPENALLVAKWTGKRITDSIEC